MKVTQRSRNREVISVPRRGTISAGALGIRYVATALHALGGGQISGNKSRRRGWSVGGTKGISSTGVTAPVWQVRHRSARIPASGAALRAPLTAERQFASGTDFRLAGIGYLYDVHMKSLAWSKPRSGSPNRI